MKKPSTKKELWEILAPEPLIIDPEIKEDYLISNLIKIESEDQINSFIVDCMMQPHKRFVVACSEKEIYDYFNSSFKNLQYTIVDNINGEYSKNNKIIAITNNAGDVVGRGIATRLGTKTTFDKMTENMQEYLSDFTPRHKTGTKRLNALMYKIKIVKSKMNVSSYEELS